MKHQQEIETSLMLQIMEINLHQKTLKIFPFLFHTHLFLNHQHPPLNLIINIPIILNHFLLHL